MVCGDDDPIVDRSKVLLIAAKKRSLIHHHLMGPMPLADQSLMNSGQDAYLSFTSIIFCSCAVQESFVSAYHSRWRVIGDGSLKGPYLFRNRRGRRQIDHGLENGLFRLHDITTIEAYQG